jgi:hypothetical protein
MKFIACGLRRINTTSHSLELEETLWNWGNNGVAHASAYSAPAKLPIGAERCEWRTLLVGSRISETT